MSKLAEYILAHTTMAPAGQNPQAANLVFFDVVAGPGASGAELRELLTASTDSYPTTMLFDGDEHSYIEIGGWLGSQQLALRLMGLGTLLEVWQLLSPRTMLGNDIPAETERKMAEMGLLSIQARVPAAA